MSVRPAGASLSRIELAGAWAALGVEPGSVLMVHSSLSSLGLVRGGASTVVASLLDALGAHGTLVAPAFTRQVSDPDPDRPASAAATDAGLRARRAGVPLFDPSLPSTMGAIPEALGAWPGCLRSPHPQASVYAVGRQAARITAGQPLAFALGEFSPFARMRQLEARVLMLGVGYNRVTFLHHAESLCRRPRLKVRRFPYEIDGRRVWVECLDVGNDNDTFFPAIGQDYEQSFEVRRGAVGTADCTVIETSSLVPFAVDWLNRAGGPELTSQKDERT